MPTKCATRVPRARVLTLRSLCDWWPRRFNNDDRTPLSHLSARDIDRYYAANKSFATILRDPASQYVIKLAPGRILLLDNWRLLHGRLAFTGHRVMAAAFFQCDEIHSKFRTMLGVNF